MGIVHLQGRDALPSHFLLKINSFSLLSKASVEPYISEAFEAGGYKWKIHIYPQGDKNSDGQGHLSIFLSIEETSSLPEGWEVNALFNFFVFDQFQDKYVGLKDSTVRRFHSMKTQWGSLKFIDIPTFEDVSNGYLVNGTCVFGAEVFVLKNSLKGQYLSVFSEPATGVITWKLDRFSSKSIRCESDLFIGGGYNWKVLLYPNGQLEGEGNSISVFLELDVKTFPSDTKLFLSYILRVKDQVKFQHHEKKAVNRTFSKDSPNWGYRKFMSLCELKDPKSGYLVDDTLIVEAVVEVVGILT